MSRLGRVPAILRARGVQVSGDTMQELEAFEAVLADEIERVTRERGTTRTHWYSARQAFGNAARKVLDEGGTSHDRQ